MNSGLIIKPSWNLRNECSRFWGLCVILLVLIGMSCSRRECVMKIRIYISADYAESNGDREVVDVLHSWGDDNKHIVEYTDTARVVSGSVSKNPDCRPCDLKEEFNSQINCSSVVIFIIGDKTAYRTAGSTCRRNNNGEYCDCTPYKHNTNGSKVCKVFGTTIVPGPDGDVGEINTYSYLEHEFRQAVKRDKTIVIVYNSLNKQPSWLPSYMQEYEGIAEPFWTKNMWGEKVGN